MEKIKFNKDSKLYFKRVIKEYVDEEGFIHKIKGDWEEATQDLNLGSVNKPSKINIIEFQWLDLNPKKSNFLRGMFND